MHPAKGNASRVGAGFTLIELLTVTAVVAVLASLLLTAVASSKKKARTMVCTSNLHQFGIGLVIFMDESDGRRPAIGDLVTGRYLTPQSLLCPEDRTGNWGNLVDNGGSVVSSSGTNAVSTNAPSAATGSVNYSYLLQPLDWDDAEWAVLKAASSRAGVAACQLHGLGSQNIPDLRSYSGLLLRAQLDGSVQRRQFYWNSPAVPGPSSGLLNASLSTASPDALQIFFDDPANWLGYQ